MEFKFNDAKSARPGHLERCLCYDKFLKGYRCYVYDDISKYWCTQATTEHDPDGENHIVDYSDFQVTEWASLSNVNKPSLPSDLDEAAEEIASDIAPTHPDIDWDECFEKIKDGIKAGAEWQKKQDDLETADLLAIAHLQGMEQQKSNMLEEAVDGLVEELYNDGESQCTVGVGTYFKPGEEVYVIKKED